MSVERGAQIREDRKNPVNPVNPVHIFRLIQFFLGSVFVYAGAVKTGDTPAFADSIASYQILGVHWINLLALTLPWFEMLMGSFVLIGYRKKAAALAILLMMAIFSVALLSTIIRGIKIDCGCFGMTNLLRHSTHWALGIDLALAFLAFSLYRHDNKEEFGS